MISPGAMILLDGGRWYRNADETMMTFWDDFGKPSSVRGESEIEVCLANLRVISPRKSPGGGETHFNPGTFVARIRGPSGPVRCYILLFRHTIAS